MSGVVPPRDDGKGAKASASARDRAVSWIVNRVLALARSKVDVKGLQERHNAVKERVCQMRVIDIGRSWKFRIHDGRLEIVGDEVRANGGFDVGSETLIALAVGRREVAHPGSGKRSSVQFTPLDAITHGEVRVWGDAASNDVLLFVRATYGDVAPMLQRELASDPAPRGAPP